MKKAQVEVREVFDRRGKVDETDINKMKYLKSIVKQTVWLHSPTPILPRECRERYIINGYEIPYKTKVIMNVWAIGRDPKHWTEAEKFYLEGFLLIVQLTIRGLILNTSHLDLEGECVQA